MNKEMILGGYIVGIDGIRAQLPVSVRPSAFNIEESIEAMTGAYTGVVTIRYRQTPEIGPYELEVYVDSGKFMLILNECDVDGENHVRTLNSGDSSGGRFVFILGEKYPAKAITCDANLVNSILNEFVQTGNVSTDLLS